MTYEHCDCGPLRNIILHVELETGVQLVEKEASPDLPDFDTLVLPMIGEDEMEEEGECETDQEMPGGEFLYKSSITGNLLL